MVNLTACWESNVCVCCMSTLFREVCMPARYSVNKSRGARKFRKQSSRTNVKNVAPPPMRGGYRL